MNLLIKNFPNDLNTKLKKRADKLGMKLYALVIHILKNNVDEKLTIPKGHK